MRVTFNSINDELNAINTASSQFLDAQAQVATGKRVRVPSDDPAAAQGIVNDHGDLASLDAYSQASDSASSRLSLADTVLGDIVDRISEATSTAESVHGTIANQTQRDAAALGIS